MRRCIVIAVRILTVLVLVAGLPLMALPPVRAQVSDWMDGVLQHEHLNVDFADLGVIGRQSPYAETVEKVGTQWQAEPVVNSSHKAGSHNLAMEDAEPNPLSSRKPNLQLSEKTSAKESPSAVDANSQIQEIRQNLIKLGAQNIRLDEVSGHPAEYHFSCSMPLGDRAVYSRKFAITDSDPIRAMTRVLDEVERWREAHSSL